MAHFAYGARSPLFLYGSRYVVKFGTRWRRWITHDDRLEAGSFREKITAAFNRFVKNAEGIVRGEKKEKRRRDACTPSYEDIVYRL